MQWYIFQTFDIVELQHVHFFQTVVQD